jgi:hypothetical protein
MMADILTEITDTTQAHIEDTFDIAQGCERQADQARGAPRALGEPALCQALPGPSPGRISPRLKVSGCSSCA